MLDGLTLPVPKTWSDARRVTKIDRSDGSGHRDGGSIRARSGWVSKYETVRARSNNPGGIQHQPDEKGLQAMCKFCGVVRQEKVDFFLHSGTGMEVPHVCTPSYL